MAASVQFRLQNRDLGMVMREVDEDLAIFLGMRGGDRVINDNSDEYDKTMRAENVQIVANDDLLSLELEIEYSEYDWLTPEKIDLQDSAMNRTDVPKDESVSLKSEIANTSEKSSLGSCNGANRKLSSSVNRKLAPRASTPTGRRPSLPEKSKPPCATTPSSRATSAPSRVSLRTTLACSKPMTTQVRSSAPSKATPGASSTLVSRTSRSATPTRKSATPLASSPLKKPVSQTVKSRPSKTLDAPKTSIPKRPASASRGRPAAQLSSKSRQKSCSPAKLCPPNANNAQKMLSRSQGFGNGGSDNVNPVLMGTKMVERVVNMRKLAPPKNDEPKKSSLVKSGFGRSLSKRSLDMAIRHMDITRSINIPGNLRPVATSVSSRVSNDNQSSSPRSSTVGSSDTSTSDSSKSSNCVESYFLDD